MSKKTTTKKATFNNATAKQSQSNSPSTSLGLKVLPNEQRMGRPSRENEMTLLRGGLNFNDKTRKRLSVLSGSYMQFLVNENSEKQGVFYATVHNENVSPNAIRVRRIASTQNRVMLPSSAMELKFMKTDAKLSFKCDRIPDGKKRSVIRFTLVKK